MVFAVIVEDNPTAANLLKEFVESAEIRVIGMYRSGEEALEEIGRLPLPDVVLVDIGLPGISGIEVTRRLKRDHPSLEIMIQTVFEDTASIVAAIKAGASGYILKASSRDEMVRAIMEVRNGGSFLSGRIARKILQEFKGGDEQASENIIHGDYGLTAREDQILRELVRGASYKEIADILSISVHTVNNHIRKIYEKMRVNSRGEAVAKAMGAESREAPLF